MFLRTSLRYIHRHLEWNFFSPVSNSRVVSRECVCVCVVTFYFALKAVSVLLGGWFLVRFLVVLLSALTVVVHPLNSILLHRITTKEFT